MTIQIFDFDGVICDSNTIKTSCLKKAVKKNINSKAADEFENHHKKNGGISRYVKFKRITEKYNCDKKIYEMMIFDASEYLKKELAKLELVEDADKLFNKLYNQGDKLYIASGGDEKEIKKISRRLEILKYFDGIYGSPNNKIDICKAIKLKHKYEEFIFYGDSKYDYECSRQIDAKFIFVSAYSESKKWFKKNMGREITYLRDLLI